jgi:Fe2+ transport system protein FeoA
MTLVKGKPNTTYTIESVQTDQEEMRGFLFSLGCYPGEKVTLISKMANMMVIRVNDARYSIDEQLAHAIQICPFFLVTKLAKTNK